MHRQDLLEKTDLLSETDEYKVWQTNDYDIAMIEYEDEATAQVVMKLQELVRKHALCTNFMERRGSRTFIVRKLDPLPVKLVAHCTLNDTVVSYESAQGVPLEMAEVVRVPGVTPSRREMMEDTVAHVARSLRGHLMDDGVTELTVRLEFGLGGQGECILQMIRPFQCDLGTSNMLALYSQLGGGSFDTASDVSRSGPQAAP